MADKNVLVPLTGTIVVRDGKRVRPEIGKAFTYTDDELTSLKAAGAKFRAPANEAPAEAPAASNTKPVKSSAEESQAEAKGGKKKATANTADKDDDL